MKFTTTSKLNIFLHSIPIVIFGCFAYRGGNSFFSGFFACLALLILIDMVECIRARRKLNKGEIKRIK